MIGSMKPLGSLLVAALLAITGVMIFGGLVTTTSRPDSETKMLMAQVLPEETATATLMPYLTSTPRPVFADCGWAPEADAYVDGNANGKRDKEERGLAGVTFHVDEAYGHLRDIQEVISDEQGVAQLGFLYPCGGPKTEFEVYAVPPAGYIQTTPAPIHEGTPVVFGFRPSKAVPGMPGTGHP